MKTIRLLTPAEGAITPPLQLCPWPEYRGQYENQGPDEFYQMAVNRGLPLPVVLAWELPPGEPVDGCDLYLATDPGFKQARTWKNLSRANLHVDNLQIGQRYYWKVIQRKEGQAAAESGVGSFETHPDPPRWLRIEGISNLRDVGGWQAGKKRVRQGMVYRSVELNSHFEITAEGTRALIDELGVRTDLDLRGEGEDTGPILDPSLVKYVNAPVDAYDQIMAGFSRSGYRLAFQTLADATSYPVLAHCWGGADRTGTFAFLLNGLLGVSLADLIHDYELTSLSGIGPRSGSSAEFQRMLGVLRRFALPGASLSKQIEGYMRRTGVRVDQIAAIRRMLLE